MMAEDAGPTWRAPSEDCFSKFLTWVSSLFRFPPLLDPHTYKMTPLIKDSIYFQNFFEQSLDLFLLLAQCDLFVAQL